MMPVVRQTFTYAEHEDLSQLWVKGKSKAQLAHEGMWTTDNATQEARDKIFSLVPAPLAFVLEHTFGRRYQGLKKRLWGGTPAFDLAPITVEEVLA